MKILNSIIVPADKKNNKTIINFGIPNKSEELKEMFRLRYKIYVEKKKYIPIEEFKDNLEKDEYDEKKECIYFIAKNQDKIIGSLRVINTNPLPTIRDYFKFNEPSGILELDSSQKIEIGRFISLGKSSGVLLPRHLVPLGLIYSIVRAVPIYKWEGGYGSIKKTFYKKLKKVFFPVHQIKKYELIFDPDKMADPLKNFFVKSDPVVPVYFLRKDVEKYFKKVFRWPLFKTKENETFEYRRNWLNHLLFKY